MSADKPTPMAEYLRTRDPWGGRNEITRVEVVGGEVRIYHAGLGLAVVITSNKPEIAAVIPRWQMQWWAQRAAS